jgi:hypothetical protein
MHKVLKRIVALPAIPQDETFEIKNRAVEILKGWGGYLQEIAAMPKEKGSGSDDKSPVKPKHEESKEDDVQPAAEPEVELEVELEADETNVDKDDGEDFVVVEGGGEDDGFAQEKAAEKAEDKPEDKEAVEDKKDTEEKDTEVGAGAHPEPADVEAMGTFTSTSLI